MEIDIKQKIEEIKQKVKYIKIDDSTLEKIIRLAIVERAGIKEIAEVLNISPRTVSRYLKLINENSITEKQIEYIMLELKKLFDFSVKDAVEIQKDLAKLTTKEARTVILYINRLKQLKNLESYIISKLVPHLKSVRYKFIENHEKMWK